MSSDEVLHRETLRSSSQQSVVDIEAVHVLGGDEGGGTGRRESSTADGDERLHTRDRTSSEAFTNAAAVSRPAVVGGDAASPRGPARAPCDGDGSDQAKTKASGHSVWEGQRLAVAYVAAETRREPASFSIGVFTVFLVVFFCTLLYHAVQSAPMIFLKLAENSVGENDLVLSPGVTINTQSVPPEGTNGSSGFNAFLAVGQSPLVNQTAVEVGARALPDVVRGTVPRWGLVGKLAVDGLPDVNVTVAALGLDLDRESEIGLGREWSLPPPLAGEAYVSESALRQIGVDPAVSGGLLLTMTIDLPSALDAAGVAGTDSLNGNGTSAAENVLGLVSPSTLSALDTVISFDARDLVTNSTVDALVNATTDALNSSGAAFNASSAASFVEDQLFSFFGLNITLPANVTGAANVTDFGNQLRDYINGLNSSSTTVNITVRDLLGNVSNVGSLLTFTISFSLNQSISSPSGKWPSSFGSVAVMDARYLWNQTVGQLRDAANQFSVVNDTLQLNRTGGTVRVSLPGGAWVDVPISNATADAIQTLLDINSSAIVERIDGLRQDDYSIFSVSMYTRRLDAYFASDVGMWNHLVYFTNQVSLSVGVDFWASFSVPLGTALQQTVWLRIFLDNLFGAVVALISALGILLVYSLLINDVEGRNYEYGMLRALGMEKRTLVQILLTKSLAFSALGIGLGLFLAYLIDIPISEILARFAALSPSYALRPSAIGLGVGLGMSVPLLANISPVRRALSHTLRDSLDVYHQVISEVTVTVIRLEELGLSLWQTTLALFMVVVGFATFYIVPYAFTFKMFGLFLAVLMAILMGMLVGLCILAVVVQPYVERAVLWTMMWGGLRRLETVVKKNMAGHRDRNRKTALMFVLCLAFIIFAGTMFELQNRSLGDNIRTFFGADLLVFAPRTSDALREEEMVQFLEQEKRRTERGDDGAVLVDYTFVTFKLDDFDVVRRTSVSNLPRQPVGRQPVYAIQSNYLQVAYDQFYVPTETSGGGYPRVGGKDDALAVMFTQAGQARLPQEEGGIRVPENLLTGTAVGPDSTANMTYLYSDYIDIVVSEAMREYASISSSVPLDIRVRQSDEAGSNVYDQHYLGKVRGMVSKVPGFFFSSYQLTASFSPAIITEGNYLRLLTDAYVRADTIVPLTQAIPTKAPKQKVLMRVTPGATSSQRDDLINGLRPLFVSDATFSVDTISTVETTDTAVRMLNLFFTVVGAIAMVMCFFILFMSFTSNVVRNGWEFGVLRSLGLNSVQVVLVYVLEALSLVLASLVLGSIIGILIAITLQVQFNLFVELPFRMAFPHQLFWSMAGMSLVVATTGSALPAYFFTRKTISDVLRRS